MFRSIRWKMVLIYLLLILLAMELIGVYLLQSLEKYYVNSFTESIEDQAHLLAGLVEAYLTDEPAVARLDDFVEQFAGQKGSDVLILDHRGVVLSSSRAGEFTGKRLAQPEISRAVSGTAAREIRADPDTGVRRLYYAAPVGSEGGAVSGVVYIIASMEEDVYRTLADIKGILFWATAVALVVTGALGFAVARTITGPIVEVTARAAEVAAGDFDQKIEVRSSDEIGRLAAMFNHLTTRLRETLGEMSREKNKVEAILEHMADGILALDAQGRIMLTNPAAAEMLGISEEQAVSRRPDEVNAGLRLDEPIRGTLSGIEGLTKRVTLSKPYRVITAHFAPFVNEAGDVNGLVIVLHDVTEQERLDQMRKEFVANVSHELRTPLATIKSYTETLLDGALREPDVARRFLGVVASETDRMVRLVSDLLQLSQISYRRAMWDVKPVSVGDVVRSALSKLAVQIERKGLDVEVRCPLDLPDVMANRDRVEQVLINVISNAVEFTPEGGRISVGAEVRDRRIAVTVEDSGVGIPEEDLPRVFERFYRVDKARSRELGGTGLGLSIAKEIVEAHGGTIGVESEPDVGTRVTFTLPVTTGDDGGGARA